LVRVGLLSFSAVVAMLATAAMFAARAPQAADSADIGVRKGDRLAVPAADAATASRSRGPGPSLVPGMRLASLDTGVEADEAVTGPVVSTPPSDPSFDVRFFFDLHVASFEERYSATGLRGRPSDQEAPDVKSGRPASLTATRARTAAVAPVAPEPPPALVRRPDRKLAMLTPARLELPTRDSVRDGGAAQEPAVPDTDGRTAIYDITARAVYLPNGKKLEAHSGLGSHMDDPQAVTLKGLGPTPPNAYRLTMRERLFHGVRAIRLVPADGGKMHGRDGMLAHPYMLGSSGQSNGCVSFSDYPAFLEAYLNGDVSRLVVVERLDHAPSDKSGPGWLADAIGSLFKPADRAATARSTDDKASALSYQ
jgi:hypothetical protein